MLRCRGKSYLDLLAQRAGDCEQAPDAVVAPATTTRTLAVLQACAEAGIAVVPFGGGTSVVGGWSRTAGGSTRWSRSTSGGWTALESRRRESLTAVFEPGMRLPEADRALGAARADARARPAELRVGDGRRLRRDALGRPGLDRPRPDRRATCVALRCATPARRARHPGRAGDRRRAGAASARDRLRGRAGRDHAGRAARPPAAGGAALRGLAACPTSRAGARRSAGSMQDGIAPDIARLSDERRDALSLAFAGLRAPAREGACCAGAAC